MTVDIQQQPFDFSSYNSFIQLFEAQAARYHDRTFVRYQASNGVLEFKSLTYGQFDRIANYLAHEWSFKFSDAPCIGFLGDEAVQCQLAMLAVFKLRRQFFAISTRVPDTMIKEMLSRTDTKYMIVSEEYQHLAEASTKGLSNIQVKTWESFDVDQLDALATDYSRHVHFKAQPAESLTDTVLLLHSSGSTGAPKPISVTNQLLITTLKISVNESSNYWGEFGYESNDTILVMVPLFHASGCLSYWISIMYGANALTFRRLPPSPRDILDTVTKYNVTVLLSPPLPLIGLADLLEQEEIDEATSTALRQIKLCLYGGDKVTPRTGDILHSNGLKIRPAYGTSECGYITAGNFAKDEEYRDSVKLVDEVSSYCNWEHFGGKVYHLMISKKYPALSPSAPINADGFYETADLFIEEPPKSGYWIHICRINDMFIMENGKVTYPTPMESVIRGASIVDHCTIVGEGKTNTAALIQVNQKQAAKYSQEEVASKVYEAVQDANKVAPRHSAVAAPGLVYILPPERKLQLISKGTVSREKAVQDFGEEIEKMYNNYSSQINVAEKAVNAIEHLFSS